MTLIFCPDQSCSHGSVCWRFDILARLPRNLPVSLCVFWAARFWHFNWESPLQKLTEILVLARNHSEFGCQDLEILVQILSHFGWWDEGDLTKILVISQAKDTERFLSRSRLDIGDLTGQKCSKIILRKILYKFFAGVLVECLVWMSLLIIVIMILTTS